MAQMRAHWRRFASENAMYYVATNRKAWEAAHFYANGERFVTDVVSWADPPSGRGLAVEIGCGAGRILVHLAREFDQVEGFDIAPEMVATAKEHGMPENVGVNITSGAELDQVADSSADLVLCTHVFQHIPDREVVRSYMNEVARVLRPDGRAVLHFDTRDEALLRRLVFRLPDRLLPRIHRRYIRRYPVPQDWPRAQASASGLSLVEERESGTAGHMLLLALPTHSPQGGAPPSPASR